MYGVLISFSTLICLLISQVIVKKEGKSTEILWGTAFWAIFFGIIGARLYHVIDRWDYYTENLGRIFEIHKGGLGIIGGIALGTISAIIYLKHKQQNIREWLDIGAVVLPLGQGLGRWGNVLNNELMYRVWDEMTADLILFCGLALLYRFYKSRIPAGGIFLLYIIPYLLIRLYIG